MNKKDSEKTGIERRKARRRAILDSFSIFVVIPKKGDHRLALRDVSDNGIGFELDIEGEPADGFSVAAGEILTLQLYLNQTLSIPLEVRVVRIEETMKMRRVGGEFPNPQAAGPKAILSFLKMMDDVAEAVKLDA